MAKQLTATSLARTFARNAIIVVTAPALGIFLLPRTATEIFYRRFQLAVFILSNGLCGSLRRNAIDLDALLSQHAHHDVINAPAQHGVDLKVFSCTFWLLTA